MKKRQLPDPIELAAKRVKLQEQDKKAAKKAQKKRLTLAISNLAKNIKLSTQDRVDGKLVKVHLREHGYVVVKDVICQEEVKRLKDLFYLDLGAREDLHQPQLVWHRQRGHFQGPRHGPGDDSLHV